MGTGLLSFWALGVEKESWLGRRKRLRGITACCCAGGKQNGWPLLSLLGKEPEELFFRFGLSVIVPGVVPALFCFPLNVRVLQNRRTPPAGLHQRMTDESRKRVKVTVKPSLGTFQGRYSLFFEIGAALA